jgi:protocatechuate 3,4-dioxygenase beta subunit
MASSTDPKSETAESLAMSRRGVLKAGAAAAAVSATGLSAGVLARESVPVAPHGATPIATTCVLAPEMTEGPYYLDDHLIRRDITEGKPGVPLRLRIVVSDVNRCAPLANAAVDIWHCDARGYYSGVSANDPGPDTDPEIAAQAAEQDFLRGIQITDANGLVEFDTIYPGWYSGRTIHIHLQVVVGGARADGDYDGGTALHTGQLFFDDAITDEVLQTEAYAGRPDEERTVNEADNILTGYEYEDEPGFFLTLTRVAEDAIEAGLIGEIAVGVDPGAGRAATSAT